MKNDLRTKKSCNANVLRSFTTIVIAGVLTEPTVTIFAAAGERYVGIRSVGSKGKNK